MSAVEVGELGASVMYFNAISVGAEKDLNGVDKNTRKRDKAAKQKTR